LATEESVIGLAVITKSYSRSSSPNIFLRKVKHLGDVNAIYPTTLGHDIRFYINIRTEILNKNHTANKIRNYVN